MRIPEDEWNPETDKLRIKAFLSIPIDGVRESNWVTQHHIDYAPAQSLNQYRIRGVSKEGYFSDWVYSELRDDENDLIIYELLYELLDVLQTANDKDIAYILDYAIEDVFQTVFHSGKPVPITGFTLSDNIKAKINELMQIFSTLFTSSFKEDVFASPKEFAEIARTYRLFEKYQEAKTDFLTLLIEHYLEEKYEELIKKVDLEVFLKNDEEMQVLLQSMYEFDIKNEIIRSLYDIEPHDHFVMRLNDAVELMADPRIFEQLKIAPRETVEQFMRLAIEELYIPLLVMDQRILELTHELSDEADIDIYGGIVEVDTFDDDDIYKLLLTYDVFELLLNNLVDPEMDFHLQFVDKIIETANQEQLSLFLEYAPVEMIEWMTNIVENFQIKYLILTNSMSHQMNIEIDEDSKWHLLKETSTFKEAYTAKIEEYSALKKKVSSTSYQVEMILDILENILLHETLSQIGIKHNLFVDSEEEYSTVEKKEKFHHVLIQKIFMNESVMNQSMKWLVSLKESLKGYPFESFLNVWQVHPHSLYNKPLIEKRDIEINQDLTDQFIMNGEEVVRYILGEVNGDWPVGQFILGTNTLKMGESQTGESSN
jgi:hypothetical protein